MSASSETTPTPAESPPIAEGAVLVRQGDTLPLAQLAAADHSYLDDLTLSQRRYLAALQGGATLQEALLRAGGDNGHSHGVSGGSVAGWLRSSPAFARAYDAIQAGLAVMGVSEARRLAVADMPNLAGHWARKATRAKRDRDQATFGRLVGELAGALGQGAGTTVQIANIVQVPGVVPGPQRRRRGRP